MVVKTRLSTWTTCDVGINCPQKFTNAYKISVFTHMIAEISLFPTVWFFFNCCLLYTAVHWSETLKTEQIIHLEFWSMAQWCITIQQNLLNLSWSQMYHGQENIRDCLILENLHTTLDLKLWSFCLQLRIICNKKNNSQSSTSELQ